MFPQMLSRCTRKLLEDDRHSLSYAEACEIAALPPETTFDLILFANKIRNHYRKKLVLCSIVNAKSGLCSEDCAFCAQSAHHRTQVPVHPLLSEEEMVERAVQMHKAGAREYSMVTSGYALTEDEIGTISRAAAAIRQRTDLTICASLGVLTQSAAEKLRAGGISSYHHNLETARSFFDRVCTTHDYEDDVRTVRLAKAAGFAVCSGGIFGLGETWGHRVELAFTLKELDVDSIPLNFLNPIAGTEMGDRPLLSPMEALKCIALFRFIHPRKDIVVCGGREVTLRDLQSWMFAAGANGFLMGNYLTTPGRDIQADITMIRDLGLNTMENT